MMTRKEVDQQIDMLRYRLQESDVSPDVGQLFHDFISLLSHMNARTQEGDEV